MTNAPSMPAGVRTSVPRIRDAAAVGRTLKLPAVPTAPRQARAFVTLALRTWRVKDEHVDTAELLISELVTNAVKQTGRVEGPPTAEPSETTALIGIRVRHIPAGIVLAVWDNDPTPPVMTHQTHDTENGRGLFLVTALTRRWSYYYPQAGGKVVWCWIEMP
jgi:anti-sigma regulatory factor (Ser/Thr protein kinase)